MKEEYIKAILENSKHIQEFPAIPKEKLENLSEDSLDEIDDIMSKARENLDNAVRYLINTLNKDHKRNVTKIIIPGKVVEKTIEILKDIM